MAHLMVSHHFLLLGAHDAVFFLLAGDHHFHGLKQIALVDIFAAMLDSVDGRFIDHIGQIRANRPRGGQRNCIQIHGFIHQHIFGMHLQGFHPSLQIWLIDNNPAVKPSWAQQCLVQYLRTVGGRQDQQALGCVKPIHFRQ